MKLIPQSPAKTLHPAYRVRNVERSRLERFKTELARLLEQIGHSAQESEEHLKNIVSDFLKETYYRGLHFVNTKDRQDLVIHNGPTAKDSAGVILETKTPGNKAEMISPGKPNTKALQELLRYYLNERIRTGNKEIRHLIVTDIYTWYIFDAADFERHIYANNKLQKEYTDWSEGRFGAANTDWFYKEIAAPFFEKELPELRCCTFDLRDYATAATDKDSDNDESLLDLYKIFSPEHLLKKPFANDSNALNKQFYDELLYIIGLEEVKEGGKKIIDRAGKRRHDGSLLENTLSELEVSGVWRDVAGLDQFGDTPEYQRFSIALELCITWLNRILFLKLLEGQLLRWRGGSDRLLSVDKVKDYDELNELFFHVLAVPEHERRESVQKKFGNVPYLNSSLFEQTELERRTLRVSALKDRLEMPMLPNSVLRQGSNPPKQLQTLAYLFAFLDAYDFSSDAKARIQAENRAVINASVLGLIFEKINGYRDGSFYTPGFITMYMCRETLRRAVLQKFNERYGWDCTNVETELHNALIRQKTPLGEANALLNSLRICDPAVGSGHFLVSALNELIAIKSDLGIICDPGGKLLPLNAVVGNDELILTDPATDQPVEYRPGNAASQRVQETLFHEKQTMIENCLFGVDINPKSVMICRLRLWIELLKHAYFTADSRYERLETLPNIDINIKAGNSLISRFALEEDLKEVFAKGKIKANDYRLAVAAYKNATDKTSKAQLLEQIGRVKSAIYESFYLNNPLNKKLKKLLGDRFLLENKAAVGDLFEKLKSQDISEDLNKINREVAALETQIEELKQGKTYRNSFEWRFEFPEVLDDEGRYMGFDVVLGNPPYISIQDLKNIDNNVVIYYKNTFETTKTGNFDIYIPFIELMAKITNIHCNSSYILPSKFLTTDYGRGIRNYLTNRSLISKIIDFEHFQVFDSASTYTCVIFIDKNRKSQLLFIRTKPEEIFFIKQENRKLYSELEDSTWVLNTESIDSFTKKIFEGCSKLIDLPCEISRGSSTGDDNVFILRITDSGYLNGYGEAVQVEPDYLIKPIFATDYSRYLFKPSSEYYLIFPYNWKDNSFDLLNEEEIKRATPKMYEYLVRNSDHLKKRKQYGKWYSYSAARNLKIHGQSDILIPLLADKGLFTIMPKNDQFTLMAGGGFSISIKNSDINNKYLLSILNSKLIFYILYNSSNKFRGGYITCTKQYLENLPIKIISQESQQPYISLVTRILAAKKSDPKADTSSLEAEIDRLVYGLYGLTEEEIAIVES